MRIDKFLKVSRIIKRRTVASDACDASRVSINGKTAKSSAQLKIGDTVEVKFGASPLRFRVLSLQESTRKEDADSMYEILA